MEDIESEGIAMGYLGRHNNYSADAVSYGAEPPLSEREEGVEVHNPFEEDRAELRPSISHLERAVDLLQRDLNVAKRELVENTSKVNQVARELREAKAELAKAKKPVTELARKLRTVRNFGVVIFTTDTGHTYAALRAGMLWYATQNGKKSPKPPMGSLQLAKLIGNSSVRVATHWGPL